ncbi:MAG: elongation factor G, partial [Thermoguttaceae bacterium]
MAKYKVEDIRNIAICGHGSAGKTTLVDTLLHKTGTLNRQGSVDEGTSVCDFDDEEKHHKYTIEATVTHFEHAGKRFNVIDTPGYPDFLGQTISALYGVDTAAIVINAASGIEVNTRRVFAEAKNVGLGRMIVINKLDSENVDFPALIESIQEVFGAECVLLNVPIGQGSKFSGVASTLAPPADTAGAVIDPAEINESLIESIVMADETMMEAYLEGNMPRQEQISQLLVRAVADGSLVPVLCVSGKTGVGLAELLDAMAMCALPPTALPRTAKNAAGEDVQVVADPAGPLVAQVFKTRVDPFVQKLSFIRVFSGTLKKDTSVAATGARKGLKIAQLLELQASETSPVDEAIAGSIVAVVKMEDLHTGMTLGDLTMPALKFPTPMVGMAVTPKSRNDQTKLSGALQKLVEEDPTFHRDLDAQTKETVITGMSELHLQILQERLKRRDKVEVDTKPPKIPYRETVQSKAEGSYRHKKQSGGSGQFAEVHIRMFPLPSGTNIEEYATKEHFPSMKVPHYDEANNFLWIDSVVGGTIPSNFMPAVEKGFR